MSLATRLQIADALVTALANALPATGDLANRVIERRIVPDYEPEDLRQIHIVVVPNGRSDVIETQATNEGAKTIDIGIMRWLPDPENDSPDNIQGAALDTLCNLVDQVCDLWGEDGELRELAMAGCDWMALELTVPVNATLLTDHRIFQAIISLTYQE